MFSTLFFAFAAVGLPILALAALAGASASRPVRVAALGVAGIGLGASYLAGADLMGRPKPARLEFFQTSSEEARIVASHYVEGRAIWLWLILPGKEVPRAYELPWSRKAAEALRRAQAEAEANGTEARIRRPFRNSEADNEDDSAPVFYAPPRPPMPKKTAE